MGFFKADWVSRGPVNSQFNPIMMVHGKIHHFPGVMVSPLNLLFPFLLVYIHDADYSTYGEVCPTQIRCPKMRITIAKW